ncbi:MAG: hypothetical protein GW772_07990 [Flavobacteriia bacterium]|nr:hypothetical protein [Flavobacteriia bacterium]OIP48352.1 MAG: hypothetical protein AUK46_01805 [Flavobacteriaceae bacterium CG2_30_31_66]PIV96299.1 MAG: hypothetical protein COW43_09210 [Flavobacteriaceae bacterium CG17_big_fil_post_rev_8_21_14_2_50_31_13]PIX15090.1 MAG: hypothetical protein COZ74_01250 [Flavobacteriaceae bacterium CG_4_8_14_3_um_filter_31_8]PIY13559.1 MAG: hypothetical protein COZ16_13765 [Flavobacteriaceae bacterium CG_4_10_14_3_um_filter_31_253]PIZ09436.1 MAG: hypotheti
MKKVIVFSLLTVIFLSCKSSQSVVNTKLDNRTEVALKGDWMITSVEFPSSDYFNITSFNIADSKCFEGSEWRFISNNNKGEMMLKQGNCTDFNSQITWYINKEGFMVLKFLTEGIKSKHTETGYVLKLASVTENMFQLIDKVNLAGKTVNIMYNFERKQ